MFYHLAPEPNPSVTNAASIADGRLILTLQVPILDMSAPSATWVEDGTVGVVIMGFLWVVWKLLGVGGFGAVKDGKGKEKEQ